MKRFIALSLFTTTLALSALTAQAAGFDKAAVIKKLETAYPQLKVDEVTEVDGVGMLQVVSGTDVFYVTNNASHLFAGNLIDVEKREDLTEGVKSKLQYAAIKGYSEDKMVVFPATENKDKERVITVFTDTSCPYCSKLHAEVPELNKQGIKVRYLLYPRAGVGSPAHKVLESVYCAKDQQNAMTMAKEGKKIDDASCDNPIAEHIDLARKVGLRGTPLVLLDTGEVVSGYRPAALLAEQVKSRPAL